MKKILVFLSIIYTFNSCSESESSNDGDEMDIITINTEVEEEDNRVFDAPQVRSYVTFISQNSVILNGFIDNSNRIFNEPETYKIGFILRPGEEDDSSNDEIIEFEDEIEYANGQLNFSSAISDFDSLEPDTTYYYTAYTKNGSSEDFDWNSFTTSAIACEHSEDNYYTISEGVWKNANVENTGFSCCGEGNFGLKFGTWPDIIEVRFNELNNGYPKTGQYFGVDNDFSTTSIERELVMSSNQVLITNGRSTPQTELFVENDGETITLIFCDTVFRSGTILNGKVSVQIP